MRAGVAIALVGATLSIASNAEAFCRKTSCNEKTGYCDPLPCRGECLPHEQCVQEGLTSRCTSGKRNVR